MTIHIKIKVSISLFILYTNIKRENRIFNSISGTVKAISIFQKMSHNLFLLNTMHFLHIYPVLKQGSAWTFSYFIYCICKKLCTDTYTSNIDTPMHSPSCISSQKVDNRKWRTQLSFKKSSTI